MTDLIAQSVTQLAGEVDLSCLTSVASSLQSDPLVSVSTFPLVYVCSGLLTLGQLVRAGQAGGSRPAKVYHWHKV